MEKELVKDAGLFKKVCNVLDILRISNFFTSDKSDKSIANSIREYLEPDIDMDGIEQCNACGCIFSGERNSHSEYLYATSCYNCDIVYCDKNCSSKYIKCFSCSELLCPKCKRNGECDECDRPLCLGCTIDPRVHYTCNNCKDYKCCNPCGKKNNQCRKHCLKCVKESISCSNKECVSSESFICSICDIHKECGKAFCRTCMYEHNKQKCKICQKSCHYPFCSKECVEIEYQRSLEKLA